MSCRIVRSVRDATIGSGMPSTRRRAAPPARSSPGSGSRRRSCRHGRTCQSRGRPSGSIRQPRLDYPTTPIPLLESRVFVAGTVARTRRAWADRHRAGVRERMPPPGRDRDRVARTNVTAIAVDLHVTLALEDEVDLFALGGGSGARWPVREQASASARLWRVVPAGWSPQSSRMVLPSAVVNGSAGVEANERRSQRAGRARQRRALGRQA